MSETSLKYSQAHIGSNSYKLAKAGLACENILELTNDFRPQDVTFIGVRKDGSSEEGNNLIERVVLLFHNPAKAELASALSSQSPLRHREVPFVQKKDKPWKLGTSISHESGPIGATGNGAAL